MKWEVARCGPSHNILLLASPRCLALHWPGVFWWVSHESVFISPSKGSWNALLPANPNFIVDRSVRSMPCLSQPFNYCFLMCAWRIFQGFVVGVSSRDVVMWYYVYRWVKITILWLVMFFVNCLCGIIFLDCFCTMQDILHLAKSCFQGSAFSQKYSIINKKLNIECFDAAKQDKIL